jgi:hypothetical protein
MEPLILGLPQSDTIGIFLNKVFPEFDLKVGEVNFDLAWYNYISCGRSY